MNPDLLRQLVDAVIAESDDDEKAHSMEDALHLAVIALFCPGWVKYEIARLTATKFARWYA